MKPYLIVIATIIFGSSCKGPQNLSAYQSDSLTIEQLTKSTFIHTSYLQTESYGQVPCNGMVVINNGEAVVFDTPVDDKAAIELLNWIKNKLRCEVKAVVVTHFHVDCLGGLNTFHNNDVASYANTKTIELAKANSTAFPENGFENSMEIKVGDEKVIIEFPGEGHTVDNIVGYFPSEKVLFGGCLIKADGSGKGNLADANTKAWSETVRKVQSKFADAEVVIPGHGKYGGQELLTYTIELFQGE